MKTLRAMLGLAMVAGLMFFSSCSKDETQDLTPSINFAAGTGYVSGDATLQVNEDFKVGINAFANTNSGSKLAKLTITRVFNNYPVSQDTVFSAASINLVINATANSQVGPEKWYFKVTDKDGQSKEISLTITTVAGASPINTFTMKIMGAQGSSTGSSFASIDGTVYSLANAKTNAAKVDWLYFYGATNLATLAAPNDADAISVFNDPTNGLATWAVKNATKFKKVTDAITWADITTDAVIVAQTASGVTNTKINNLAANDVLAFITASGKKGMIKVESISGTTDGTITISVKVQQ
ncbi:MAG TPA: hypothetical protein PKG48_12620 [Bacteroidales bacterium]|nr:hypothetical protein [Bacteroidales bacterium]